MPLTLTKEDHESMARINDYGENGMFGAVYLAGIRAGIERAAKVAEAWDDDEHWNHAAAIRALLCE